MKKSILVIIIVMYSTSIFSQNFNFEGTWHQKLRESGWLWTITLQKKSNNVYYGTIIYDNEKMDIEGVVEESGDLKFSIIENGRKQNGRAWLCPKDNGGLWLMNNIEPTISGLPAGCPHLGRSSTSSQSYSNYNSQQTTQQQQSYTPNYSQQTTQQQNKRYISVKVCTYQGAYYAFSINGRVESYSFNYNYSGKISGTEKYQHGSYYIDDSKYENLIINWDNGATEKMKIQWSNNRAFIGNSSEANCN